MKFVYPAVIKKTEDGYYGYFPDLEMCDAKGATQMQLEERLRDACINWITLELDEGGMLPSWSTEEDLELGKDEKYQYIAVNIQFMPGYEE
jgi:predicted RNase H-like HicB family nuclease